MSQEIFLMLSTKAGGFPKTADVYILCLLPRWADRSLREKVENLYDISTIYTFVSRNVMKQLVAQQYHAQIGCYNLCLLQ